MNYSILLYENGSSHFFLNTRCDRIGTEILSLLFQFYFCYINNYYIKYDICKMQFSNSIFLQCILKIIDEYNINIKNDETINSLALDEINIPGPGGTDMTYGMGKIVQIIKSDMLSFFKNNFYNSNIACK